MNIFESIVDWRDVSALNEVLISAYTFAEAFNSFSCARLFDGYSSDPSFSEEPVIVGKSYYTRSLIEEFKSRLGTGIERNATPLLSLLSDTSPNALEITNLRAVADHLLASPDLPPLPRITELHPSLFAARQGQSIFLSTRRPSFQSVPLGKVRAIFSDEIFDPIDICRSLLARVTEGRDSELFGDFLIQRFLRSEFRLRFRPETKYVVPVVVRAFNEIFYGEPEATWGRSSFRSSLLNTDYFISILTDCLRAEFSDYAKIDIQRSVACFFLFFRFCRTLRVRYFRFTAQALEGHQGLFGDSSVVKGQSLGSLRKLEHGYFLNRVFGSLSEISGLNFVFRGGILPRTDSGRSLVLLGPAGSGKTSFALQKLCGIAARGGLAVYFSFEERFELLVDRIVMFGLRNGDEFEVVGPPQDPFAELDRLSREDSKKGVLVLFGFGQAEDFDLMEIITRLSELDFWKWRAIAIDSVNALELRINKKSLDSNKMRPALQGLVEGIENGNFLGVIISEESGHRIEELEYIADTIIHFGFGSGDRSRWIEIGKCRTQNYHGGRHLLRLIEGEGIKIIPSLGAVRSALRRRTFGTLRREYMIKLGKNFESVDIAGIREKSATLVLSSKGVSLNRKILDLALMPLVGGHGEERAQRSARVRGPRSVLVISFKTPEARLLEVIRNSPEVQKQWDGIPRKVIRWFSPGETMEGAQVVWEISDHIKKARRSAAPIERILFLDAESVARALPSVGNEDLFWLTLFQLLGVEAVASFWGFNMEDVREEEVLHHLDIVRSQVDYVLRLESDEPKAEDSVKIVVEKLPPPPQDPATVQADESEGAEMSG